MGSPLRCAGAAWPRTLELTCLPPAYDKPSHSPLRPVAGRISTTPCGGCPDAVNPISDEEPRAVMSAGEERFERLRRRVGFVLAPLVFAALLLAPLEGLKPEAHR